MDFKTNKSSATHEASFVLNSLFSAKEDLLTAAAGGGGGGGGVRLLNGYFS